MTEINATPAQGTEQRPITVKLSKLTEGIGMVFSGVLTMLEALDASSAKKLLELMESEEGSGGNTTGESGKPGDSNAANSASSDLTAVKEEATAEVAEMGTQPELETLAKQKTQAKQKAQPKKPSAPTVTQDDITKIIVQKIKKNRSNNEKIGAILKAYGVAKVSDLPEAKYEAFLTDLSQI